jgi:hypothetical protein
MKKVLCIYFILFSFYYSISYAQYTLAPDGSYVGSDSYSLAPDGSYEGYDKSDSESTNDTFGQDWNNFGQ